MYTYRFINYKIYTTLKQDVKNSGNWGWGIRRKSWGDGEEVLKGKS
jgi:hypothetical protein